MIDFSQLDKIIHEKGRLAIMTLLASRAEPWPFQDLKTQLDMSDGNLITHLRTLENFRIFFLAEINFVIQSERHPGPRMMTGAFSNPKLCQTKP